MACFCFIGLSLSSSAATVSRGLRKMQVRGLSSDLNDLLSSLVYVGEQDWNTPTYGYDRIDLAIKLDTDASANAASTTATTTFRDNIFVGVTAVNDPPAIVIPTSLAVADEDVASTISSIYVVDPDADEAFSATIFISLSDESTAITKKQSK